MPRGKAVYHYATKADYEIILKGFEEKHAVKYVLNEWRETPEFQVYSSPFEYPEFTSHAKGHWALTRTFYIFPFDEPIRWEFMAKRVTKEKFWIPGQPENPKTVFFRPSGHYKGPDGEAVLMGEFSTISDDPVSQAMFRTLKKLIRKHFEHFDMEYAGPEAVRLMDVGIRLCQTLEGPRGADLTRYVSEK